MTLKKSVFLALVCTGAALSSSAQVITQWTFETSLPSGAPGAGVSSTAYAPEVGASAGVAATGHHAAASTYSNPAGDGSSHSFSSTAWAVGDYYQFTSTISDFSDVTLSYEQNGSGSGPADFQLSYSTDGASFTSIGSVYTLPAGITWTAGAGAPVGYDLYTYDLGSISALSGNPMVYFRISDAATTSINNGTVAAAGTDRVDDFILEVTPTPEPATCALLGLGAAMFCGFRRRK